MIANIVQNHLDIIVFFVALLAERFFPLVSWYHPNTFLTVIFSALSDRLYNPTNPKSYQYLASTLAFTLTILVIVTLVVLFLEFAFYPELLSGLILYLLLSSRAQEKKSLRIARLLKLNQNRLLESYSRALLPVMYHVYRLLEFVKQPWSHWCYKVRGIILPLSSFIYLAALSLL